MKANVGGIDRTLRIVVGLLLIGLGAAGTLGTWSWIVGLILAATGVFRFCGLYTLIGVNTCKLEQRGGSA
jgi:hypothetical protein